MSVPAIVRGIRQPVRLRTRRPSALLPARCRSALLRACCVAALLVIATGPAAADLGGFVISSFDADLTVRPDADLIVEEHLDVDFLEPRHGIYRTIPVHYTDPLGYSYSLDLRVLDVTDGAGHSHKFVVKHAGRYINIRIGDADRTVQGRVHYALRYQVRDAVGHFSQYDEIYWNVTGNEWNTVIERASATVHLPAPLPPDSLQAHAFLGRFGSREQGAAIDMSAPGRVTFSANRRLESLEGLTLAVAWPRGYVTVPGAAKRAQRFLADNWVLLAPLAALAGLWTRYRRQGRDPRGPAAVMVRYEAPPGVTPGEIGTLIDERVDLRDITATLVDLAVRGYLVIRIEKREILLGLSHRDETIFERTEKDTVDLLPHEVRLLEALFASGKVVEASALKERFYVHIPEIRSAVYNRLVKQGHFAAHPGTVRTRYVVSGFLIGIAVFGLGIIWAASRGAIFPNATVVPIVSGVASAVLFFVFAPAMPRRTQSGVQLRAWALGFEEFVDRVEGEQLERDRARNIFEAMLPYAMALGVASRWARRFEGLYDQPPTWFRGGSPGATFSSVALHSALVSAMDRAGSTMTAAPRSSSSSGSGGGGSSGGGGGGGGGGSW